MKPLMAMLMEEFEKSFEEGGVNDPHQEGEPAGPDFQDYIEGAQKFYDFSTNLLNRLMGPDYIILDNQKQQYVLTDRQGAGSLPPSHAVQIMIADPYTRDMPPSGAVRVNG